ncbi:MAG TPA: XRE family transcriptional regulator [Candidatus Cloacimonas sp.]|jgi:SOS-response transcriptional repressor LexA|nr:helix-turn-helix domain-containing protein [Candidatus Cloacimonas sp.]MDD2250496.1 XRE family transcriptional regulator [Candidatus Cloacimonadota bacterium]MCK9157946.1 XRE family transcriptional regulator [Candidatus Cloacimonas sp.]MCK9164814.1 XRE family transcriptional regulator [Candidatus Cloacimonas sp.]MDD3734148.1 XRE family transcriptional regulator [Candidatus Cloacimonadota bacterium]
MIGQRIKQIRTALGIKQVELAKVLKMNPSAVSQIESGRTNPSLETLSELGKIYNINLHWLITGTGEMFNTIAETESQSGAWDNFQKLMNERLEEIVQARKDLMDSDIVEIAVSGEIAAGAPIENYGASLEVVTVSRSLINGSLSDFVALRVNGRSMEPDIRNQDVVLIRLSNEWRELEGKICAIRIDGGITLKRLLLDDARKMVVLVPINEDFQPIIVDPDSHSDVTLIGSLYFLFRILS